MPGEQFSMVGVPVGGQANQRGAAGDERGVDAEFVGAAVAAAFEFVQPALLALVQPPALSAQWPRRMLLGQSTLHHFQDAFAAARGEVVREDVLQVASRHGGPRERDHEFGRQDEGIKA